MKNIHGAVNINMYLIPSHVFIHLLLTLVLRFSYNYYFLFTDEETETVSC